MNFVSTPTTEQIIKFDDESTWPATWIERCQIVAEDMIFRHRETGEVIKRTAQEVYNSSPTGELMFVHFWFLECVFKREATLRLRNGEDPEAVVNDMYARYKKMLPV